MSSRHILSSRASEARGHVSSIQLKLMSKLHLEITLTSTMSHIDNPNAPPVADPSRVPPMGASAHVHQSSEPSSIPTSVQSPGPQPIPEALKDIVMTDGNPARAAVLSPSPSSKMKQ